MNEFIPSTNKKHSTRNTLKSYIKIKLFNIFFDKNKEQNKQEEKTDNYTPLRSDPVSISSMIEFERIVRETIQGDDSFTEFVNDLFDKRKNKNDDKSTTLSDAQIKLSISEKFIQHSIDTFKNNIKKVLEESDYFSSTALTNTDVDDYCHWRCSYTNNQVTLTIKKDGKGLYCINSKNFTENSIMHDYSNVAIIHRLKSMSASMEHMMANINFLKLNYVLQIP